MVERLKEFVVSLEAEKNDILTADFEEVIKTKVADFEAQIRAEFADMREKRVAEKEVEINVIKRFIEAEEKRAEEEAYRQFLAERERELENSTNVDEANDEILEISEQVSVENL